MERFAIKVSKSARKVSAKKLCRLCGIDNPDKVPILDTTKSESNFFDGEPDLSKKIFNCVGIQVVKNDKMPQSVCQLCCDKINDFYEYREMCAATNIQTRKLLGLPEFTKALKTTKRRKLELELEPGEETIFGVLGDGDEIKVEDVPGTDRSIKTARKSTSKIGKKYRKKNDDSTVAPSEKATTTFTQKPKSVAPLLTLKAPNKREMMREKVQKCMEKKRKPSGKATQTAPGKKIKQETTFPCEICAEEFSTSPLHNSHLISKHIPYVHTYGCSSCCESFQKEDDNKLHHDWHKMFSIAYVCVICAQSFDRLITFNRHISTCTVPVAAEALVDNITCDLCQYYFVTRNLYDWHDCFIQNNGKCSKCQRVFGKKAVLFKHIFKCEGKTVLRRSQIVVEIPGQGELQSGGLSELRRPLTTAVKAEPEAILEPGPAIDDFEPDDEYNDMGDDHFMDSHADDADYSSDDQGPNESPSVPAAAESDPPQSTYLASKRSALLSECESRVLRVCLENIEPTLAAKATPSTSSTSESKSCPIKKKNKKSKNHKQNQRYREDAATNTLLSIRVKQEPVDYTDEYPAMDHVEDEQPLPSHSISQPRVSIKKEVLQAEYGDFDPEVARNIKRERGESNSFKPPPLRLKIQKRHGSLNATILNDVPSPAPSAHLIESEVTHPAVVVNTIEASHKEHKSKKLYKKPALLAIKIKQERVEREELINGVFDNDDAAADEYINSSDTAYIDNVAGQSTLPSLTEEIRLPVIAEVSSVAEVGSAQGTAHMLALAFPEDETGNPADEPTSSATLSTKNSFTPVRIKLEPQDRTFNYMSEVCEQERHVTMNITNSFQPSGSYSSFPEIQPTCPSDEILPPDNVSVPDTFLGNPTESSTIERIYFEKMPVENLAMEIMPTENLPAESLTVANPSADNLTLNTLEITDTMPTSSLSLLETLSPEYSIIIHNLADSNSKGSKVAEGWSNDLPNVEDVEFTMLRESDSSDEKNKVTATECTEFNHLDLMETSIANVNDTTSIEKVTIENDSPEANLFSELDLLLTHNRDNYAATESHSLQGIQDGKTPGIPEIEASNGDEENLLSEFETLLTSNKDNLNYTEEETELETDLQNTIQEPNTPKLCEIEESIDSKENHILRDQSVSVAFTKQTPVISMANNEQDKSIDPTCDSNDVESSGFVIQSMKKSSSKDDLLQCENIPTEPAHLVSNEENGGMDEHDDQVKPASSTHEEEIENTPVNDSQNDIGSTTCEPVSLDNNLDLLEKTPECM